MSPRVPNTLPVLASRHSRGDVELSRMASAIPVVVREVAALRPVVDRKQTPVAPARRRTNQERIDAACKLRRKGISFKEIGARLQCSERTARRIASHVEAELTLPAAESGRDTDPRELREALLARFFDRLYRNPQLRSVTIIWRTDGGEEKCGPPSSRFLSIAEAQLRKRLAELGPHMLRCLAVDPELQTEFLRDNIGALFGDYFWWHRPPEKLYVGIRGSNGEPWRPPWERPEDERPGFIYLLELEI
jgi:hypothetical protein